MMNVLLVEDNAAMRAQIKQMLKGIPGTSVVMETGSQRDARAWLAEHPKGWDLAVVDLFLEEGNGFRVLQHCVKTSARQKAVALSNYAKSPVPDHAMAQGADAFFDKSFDLDGFIDYCMVQAAACAANDDPTDAGQGAST